jgi:hypothetical protein
VCAEMVCDGSVKRVGEENCGQFRFCLEYKLDFSLRLLYCIVFTLVFAGSDLFGWWSTLLWLTRKRKVI